MGFGSADYVHRFVEAKKLAFEDRARFYADPDFADVPVDGPDLQGVRRASGATLIDPDARRATRRRRQPGAATRATPST